MNKQSPALNTRILTAEVLQRVMEQGESLNSALPAVLAAINDARQQAFIKAMSYGVLRWYIRLDALSRELIKQAVKQRDRDVYYIILIALLQLSEQSAPDYAVVSESVNAVGHAGKHWAKKFVNGVLRSFNRQRVTLLEQLEQQDVTRFSVPQWLINRLQRDWPQHWENLLHAGNAQGPMVLRVNTRAISREDYINKLALLNVVATPVAESESALQLSRPCQVDDLPGFSEGWVSVQDAAAQFAAPLLNAQPGDRVLDACAAPGGKLLHILQGQPLINQLVAVEIEARRLSLIEDNLQRNKVPGPEVLIKLADAANLQEWWDGRMFQRILLDAPCSASGVIRRHPDIKMLRRESDIRQLAKIQSRLLDVLWDTLAPGGLLLYSTCSVFKEENEYQLAAFLQRTENARSVDLPLNESYRQSEGYQLMTGVYDRDGFYYAALQKNN